MTKKENTKLINLLFEVYRKGAEGIECNLDDSLKELLEVINVIQCCTQLKTFKIGETVILDNKVDAEVITPESSVLIKDSRDGMLMWVNRERLKTK